MVHKPNGSSRTLGLPTVPLLELAGVLLTLAVPVTMFVGMSLPYILDAGDGYLSGGEFFWTAAIVGSLCAAESRLGDLVELMLEKRLGCGKKRDIVDWGNDGFRQNASVPGQGVLVGRVVVHEAVLEGPDGRPCVAALRVLEKLAHENQWCAFVVETPQQRVLVNGPREGPLRVVGGSWRIEAARPRWFGGGAIAPLVAAGERLDWVVVRPGDTVRIEASFHGEHPLSNELPEILRAKLGEREPPSQSPYRPLAPFFEVRVGRRSVGLTDDGGPGAPITVDVISASTVAWDRRARVQESVTSILGLLGANMLILGLAGSGDFFSAFARVAVLLAAGVLLVMRIGVWVADVRWWARPPRPVAGETDERGDQSS